MPHISKQKIKEEIFRSMFDRFIDLLSRLKNKEKSKEFFFEFLTYTERVMLAKRLSAIFLLSNNASTYEVENVLKISSSTTARILLKLETGGFKNVKHYMNNSKFTESFLLTLEKILQAGLPPRGRGRWKNFFDKYK